MKLNTTILRAVGASLLTGALALGLTACGDDDAGATDNTSDRPARTASSISISEPWARGTVGSNDASMSAVFMLIDNNGDDAVQLESASAAVAGRTELHEMAMKDGDMVMQQVQGGITIEPGKDMLLQPGGYHVMLMDLTEELVPGTEIEVALTFSDGSTQTLTVPVKEFTEEEGHYHEPGTPEHTHGGDDKVVSPDAHDDGDHEH